MILFLCLTLLILIGLFFYKRKNRVRFICEICEIPLEKPTWIDELAFCSKHSKDYECSDWVELENGHASPGDPEYGVKLYEFKNKLVGNGISALIKTNYKEVNSELITEMKLLVREGDLEKAKALSRID